LQRSKALVDDPAIPLGTTESYPLPGVTTLMRVEPSLWGRVGSDLVQGCFRSAAIYVPAQSALVKSIEEKKEGISQTTKLIGGLTIVSLTVGIIATVTSLRKRKKAAA
jgi:hypothetical protein